MNLPNPMTRAVVVAPSVRTTSRPTRRRRCFITFDANPADPPTTASWHRTGKDDVFETRDAAILTFHSPGACCVFVATRLPTMEPGERLPVREITPSFRLV